MIPATVSEGIWPLLVVNPPKEARWTNNLRTDFDDLRPGLKGRGAGRKTRIFFFIKQTN
jgi:hypothetical protein